MLWSINSCQNRGPLTSITWPYRGLRNRPIEYFLKLSADNLPVFKWSQAEVHFLKYRRNKLSRTIKILISNWPRTRKFSQLLQTGKTVAFDFSHHGHALVTLYVQFLCSDWSKFDRWVHAENLFSILNLVYFDSWSWQSFLSTCDVFNCLFPLDVQNEIQLLSGVFCSSWLVGFWLRNTSLVKVGNPISDGIVFVFHLGWGVSRLQSLTRYWPYLIPLRAASRMVSLINYCIRCLFFLSQPRSQGSLLPALRSDRERDPGKRLSRVSQNLGNYKQTIWGRGR